MLSETQKNFEIFFKNPLTNPKTFDIMYGSSRKINIGVSPSGKASDSDSDISGVRIPAPQPEKLHLALQDGVFQLYSPSASSMHRCVICPSDVICASRVRSYKANIISLRSEVEQYHFCEAKISR